jgi:DNA-directed RNA polymerase specialized sigma24 family protein
VRTDLQRAMPHTKLLADRDLLELDCTRLVAAPTLLGGGRSGGEDAVQEALARDWDTVRGEAILPLPAWVTVVAMNLHHGEVRSERSYGSARTRAGTCRRDA